MRLTGFLSLLFTSVIGFMITNNPASAQIPDTTDSYSRFQFAQTYVGIDLYHRPGAGAIPYLEQGTGNKQEANPGYKISPRLTIGGPHFWGYAEFFVNVPAFKLAPANNGKFDISLSPGTETGFRVYPWSIYHHKLAPFAGFSWSAVDYQQTTNAGPGPSIQLSTTYLQAGLTWQVRKSMFQLGIQYQTNSSFSYPLSRNRYGKVELNPWQAWISYKYLFDATKGSELHPGYSDENQSDKNAFSIAGGPASAFGLRSSSYNNENRSYLANPVPAALSPDISLGYHFFDLNATIRISYRRIIQSQRAFETKQRFTRTSLSFEAIKFLGDYQGFVPFIGLFTGPEFLAVSETDRGTQTLDIEKPKWTAGLSVGWDIRPTPAPPIVLRTNIRYAPFLSLEMPDGNQIRFDHLEVDFIQIVVYPRRLFNF